MLTKLILMAWGGYFLSPPKFEPLAKSKYKMFGLFVFYTYFGHSFIHILLLKMLWAEGQQNL